MCGNRKMISRYHGVFKEYIGSDVGCGRQVWWRFGTVKQVQVIKGACVGSRREECLTINLPCCKAYVFHVAWYHKWYYTCYL